MLNAPPHQLFSVSASPRRDSSLSLRLHSLSLKNKPLARVAASKRGLQDEINKLALSACGQLVAAVDDSGDAKVVELQTGASATRRGSILGCHA